MSSRVFKPKLVCLLMASITAPVLAEEQVGGLDQLVVWGTEVNTSSVHFGEDTFAIKQADHISDLLRPIPGIDVGGAHSLNQRITIRSMDDKDLRISIDGANQNTYMYHHMGNLQIHADILQSVEIDIGTNSVVNGGLGGSVRFETKTAEQLLRPGEQFGGRLQASYADNASNGYSLTGYGQLTEDVDFLAYFNSVSRDNFEVGGGKIKDADGNEIAGTNGEVKGLKGDVEDLLLKVGWDISPNQRIALGYENYVDEGDYSYRPDMGLATDLAIAGALSLPLTYDTEFTRDTYTLNYDLDWGEENKLKATLFRNNSEFKRDETALSAGIIEGKAVNTGLNVLANSVIGEDSLHTLTYGVEIINYDTEYHVDGSKRFGEDALSAALFLEDRVQITDKFAVIPGVRYNSFDLDSAVVDDRFSKVTGALALEYEVSDSFLVKLSSTQLFKAPEIGEVFIGAGLSDTANPGIDEETGYNTELALAYEDAVFGADRFSSGVTFFQTDINDYIYDYASAPVSGSWKDNIGDMTIDGVEAYIGFDKGNLSTLLTYSVAESELDAFEQYSSLDGARLDRQQGDTISFIVDYAIPKWNLALHWDTQLVDDVRADLDLDGASADNAKDRFALHNVSARWTPKKADGLVVTLGVDNLFDEYYASQSSRTGKSAHPFFGDLYLLDYEPGRNVKATVSYQF